MEKWRKKKLEAEQATKLATETVGLEVSDLKVNEEAAFWTEKRKISQVGYNRRIKKKKLEVLVNWGEKDEVTRPLQVDIDAVRWVRLDLTVSVDSLQDDTMREYTMPPS